jgi:hypothetical protein
MRYRIRQIEQVSQFCEAVTVDVINKVIGLETMQRVLEENGVNVAPMPSLMPVSCPVTHRNPKAHNASCAP